MGLFASIDMIQAVAYLVLVAFALVACSQAALASGTPCGTDI